MIAFANSAEKTVTIQCLICGKDYHFTVLKKDLEKFERGEGYVQTLFPYLSAGDREMFVSQTCNTCFEQLFPSEDEN